MKRKAKNSGFFIVEDDKLMMEMFEDFLKQRFPNADIHTFSSGEAALKQLHSITPRIILLDYHLDTYKPEAINGLEVLKQVKSQHPQLPVIILSSEEGLEISANIIKYGAFDYIVKDDHAFGRLEIVLHNALEQTRLKKDVGSQKQLAVILMVVILVLFIAGLIERFFF